MINRQKNQFKFIGTITMLFLIIVTTGCGGAEGLVKKGSLQLNPNISLKEVFDNYAYFKKVEWDSFNDTDGRKIVEVTGEIDMKKMFTMNFEGEKYELLKGEPFEIILNSFLEGVKYNGSMYNTLGDWEELDAMYQKNVDFRIEPMNYLLEMFVEGDERAVSYAQKTIEWWDTEKQASTEKHKAIIQKLAEDDFEGAMTLFNEEAAYLETDLKKNEGHYKIQFLVEGKKSFRMIYSELSLTLFVEGASGPVTFTEAEGSDYLYLRNVYNNSRLME